MPSRKKARGRQNRAKKEAYLTAKQRTQWEPTLLVSGVNDNAAASSCEHTLAVRPRIPQEGLAVSFVNCLAGEGFFDKTARFHNQSLAMTCLDSVTLHFPGVQEEDNERALAIDLLLRFVRNVLVHEAALVGDDCFTSASQTRWQFAS